MWGFRFLKYKKFCWGGFFSFFVLGLKSAEFHFRNIKKSFLLRKYKQSFLLRKYRKSFLLRKYKYLFNIRARKFHFQKYKEFFSGWIFFIFLGLGWEVQGSISRNIRKYNKSFLLRKYKSFFWGNVRIIFLILEVEVPFPETKGFFLWADFFHFLWIKLGKAPDSSYRYYLPQGSSLGPLLITTFCMTVSEWK